MSSKYTIGLDYGTNSVRALIVNVATGEEIASAVWGYAHGEAGIVLDPKDPNLARQHPRDYLEGAKATVTEALKQAAGHGDFKAADVIGLGVDTTGSTPMPVDETGEPLAFNDRYEGNPNALAWLWKDHTAHEEAAALTEAAAAERPEYLAKCGGIYSSEWFWSKLWRCAKVAPEVFEAAATWVEIADWIPAVLTGTDQPMAIKRCICAAGHKAMFHHSWGGYPDEDFLGKRDERLAAVRRTLPSESVNVSQAVGGLTEEWANALGLTAGIPVAAGAFDAHLGAVGSGIRRGSLVQIIGTSSCDMMVESLETELADIPGLCGIVPESVLPGYYGLEAGQSAVGDIYNWFVNAIEAGGKEKGSHEALTAGARALKPGESGLLGLDWHNGNRTVLVDQRLTGALLGMTLHTTPAEIYRALIESTAFGTRMILERFEEYGVRVERVINCGGIAVKNDLVMQIYADVTGRPMEVAGSDQACALGSAIAAAVVAGKEAGGHGSFDEAVRAMTSLRERAFTPDPAASKIYDRLFALYRRIHDGFGVKGTSDDLSDVMKELLAIRDEARS